MCHKPQHGLCSTVKTTKVFHLIIFGGSLLCVCRGGWLWYVLLLFALCRHLWRLTSWFLQKLEFPLKRSHLSVQLEPAGPRPWCHCGRMPTVALISGSTVHSTPVDGFWWLISTHQSSCVYFRLCEISQSNFFSCSGISFSSAAAVHTCRFRPLINTKVRKFWCIEQSHVF